MIRARAIELLKGIQFCCDFDDCTNAWDCDECVDAFNMAIEALEQEPTAEYSSDVISRQAAIDALNTGLWGVEWDKALATAMLKDLPSAQSEIIRCKDCKWWDRDPDSVYGYCMAIKHGYHSRNWEIGIYRKYKGDFYCADAAIEEESDTE